VSVVDDAVADRVGVRGFGDVLVPALVRELARHDRRSSAVPVLEYFEQITSLGVRDRSHRPVVD
jgi:hypothetical protein